MRIIAGKYKGRKLVPFKANHIRPTTDRVKESLFNILGADVEGAVVLDLFSGTGSVALEFLSRGALQVTAVDINPKSLEILQKNIALLKAENIDVVRSDAFAYLKKNALNYKYIFIDPPFTEELGDQLMMELSKLLQPDNPAIIIIETTKHEKFALEYPPLKCYDQRKFGDKNLSFFRQNI